MTQDQGVEVSAPFIKNAFDNFAMKLSAGRGIEAMEPNEAMAAYQAFYAGFSSACALLTGVQTEEDRTLVMREIKAELKIFSQATRELGRKTGKGFIRFSPNPKDPGLHVRDGGKR